MALLAGQFGSMAAAKEGEIELRARASIMAAGLRTILIVG
jgi:hypothetical protein